MSGNQTRAARIAGEHSSNESPFLISQRFFFFNLIQYEFRYIKQ